MKAAVSGMGHPEVIAEDLYTVPISERRGAITMGLLWITMMTLFPTLLEGFQWHKEGLTLTQCIVTSFLSCGMLLAYAVPAAYLGAVSGQTYGQLSRHIFGRWGSWLVSTVLVLLFIAWYGLICLLMAESLAALYKISVPMPLLSAILAVPMAFNNFFGFKGVANFARFVAAPALILWVGYAFFKVAPMCPAAVWTAPCHVSFSFALTTVSSFVIGYAVWGNEADYWRHSKRRITACLVPMAVALVIGQMVFPLTGWMISQISGITEYAAATAFMTDYSFGGLHAIAVVVLSITYFAVNDSNLYGATNALENLRCMPHQAAVLIVSLAGAATAAWLSFSGVAKSFEAIASLNCVLLPTATVIAVTEWFVISRIAGIEPPRKVAEQGALPRCQASAILALVAGWLVGIVTSGVFPCFEALHMGVCSVQAWLLAIVIYIPLRLYEVRSLGLLSACKVGRDAMPVPELVRASTTALDD